MNVNSSGYSNPNFGPSNVIKNEMFKPLALQSNTSSFFISGKVVFYILLFQAQVKPPTLDLVF
jgi:hypothetical protein